MATLIVPTGPHEEVRVEGQWPKQTLTFTWIRRGEVAAQVAKSIRSLPWKDDQFNTIWEAAREFGSA